METKKFIAGKFGNTQIANFIENGNLMDFAIFNIESKKGITKLQTLNNFYKLENLELKNENEEFLFELFGMFRTAKNAVATLLKQLETKKPLTIEIFDNQTKNTPKNYTDEIKKLKSFTDFYSFLTDEQKTTLGEIAKNFFTLIGLEQTGFKFFYINGKNSNLTLESGQYVKLKDAMFGFPIYTIVFQASPNGFVTLMDADGLITLSNESAKGMQVVEDVPSEIKAILADRYATQKENSEISRTAKLEQGAKVYARELEAEDKAEKKKAEEAKKLATSTTAKIEIEKMSLTSLDEVKNYIAKINTAKLIPDHKKELTEKVEKAKSKLEQKIKNAPKAETTTPARPRRNANKTQTTAPAPQAPAEQTTIDNIIAEDAKSENPILA